MKPGYSVLGLQAWFFILTAAFVFQFSQVALGVTRVYPVFKRYADTESASNPGRSDNFTAITKDGRYVVFATDQNKVISDTIDTNNKADVYLKDLLTGTIKLVSHIYGSGNENTPPNAVSDAPSISEVFTSGGSSVLRVAFRSCATNIMNNEGNNGYCHIYVKQFAASDLTEGTTYILSKSGSTLAATDSDVPRISGNGSYVAFQTGTNFDSGDTTSNSLDIYRQAVGGGDMTWVSHTDSSDQRGSADLPSISYLGGFVSFESSRDELDEEDPHQYNGHAQIYVWNASNGIIKGVSRASGESGSYGNDHSGAINTRYERTSDVSDDGNYVVFVSRASNLTTDSDSESMETTDIYLRNVSGSTTTHINLGADRSAEEPNISGDARFIAYYESRTSSPNYIGIRQYDRSLGTTRELPNEGHVGYPDISQDGRFVVFYAFASIVGGTNILRPIVHDVTAPAQLNNGDFNADGSVDLAFFRPAVSPTPSLWYVKSSPNYSSSASTEDWGTSGDLPAPGDFDGDGKTDYAYFRPSNGYWYIKYSSGISNSSTAWGTSGDKPVPADYDGDGKADLAVYRPSSGYWHITYSSNSSTVAIQFGLTYDVPVPGDYDKDLKTDIAVYRPYETQQSSSERGNWYVYCSSGNTTICPAGGGGGGYIIENFGGNPGDKPVQNDYDGDGETDFAIYRPGSGSPGNSHWYYRFGVSDYADITWGLAADVAMPGDYDNDGKADFVVFRPDGSNDGTWYVLRSYDLSSFSVGSFGKASDLFVPNANYP